MTFHTTRWTLVRNATGHSPVGRQALSDLCAAYYGPVAAFIGHEAFSEEAARDLAHEFFRQLLEKPSLQGADPALGRRPVLVVVLPMVVLPAPPMTTGSAPVRV